MDNCWLSEIKDLVLLQEGFTFSLTWSRASFMSSAMEYSGYTVQLAPDILRVPRRKELSLKVGVRGNDGAEAGPLVR